MTRPWSLLVGLALAAGVTGAVACSSSNGGSNGGGDDGGASGDDDGGATSGEGGATADALDRCAASSCHQTARCSPAYFAYEYGDEAGCEAVTRPACEARLAAPRTGATAASLVACADAEDAYSCDGSPFRIPDACKVKGSGKDGDACFDSNQCASGTCAYLNPTPSTTCGACVTPAGVGETCGTAAICQDDLSCASTGSGSNVACAKPQGIGQTCDATHPCGADPLAYCVAGSCVKPGAEGASCGGASDAPCDPYALLTCNAQQKCAKSTLVGEGKACGKPGVYCTSAFACVGDVCVARAVEGGSCNDQAKPCAIGLRCLSGTCVTYAEACTK